jgi:hypothetical protein
MLAITPMDTPETTMGSIMIPIFISINKPFPFFKG